jgi:hypothetical protein
LKVAQPRRHTPSREARFPSARWALTEFAAIGVHELIFDCRGQSIVQSIERLQWFATDVIPLVDG